MNLNLLAHPFKKPFYSWQNKYLKHKMRLEAQAAGLLSQAADEVAEYLREPAVSVMERFRRGNFQEFEFFREPSRLTAQAVEDYYRTNESYMYDLPFWNAETNRPRLLVEIMKGRLKQFGCRNVMDFGAGAGDLCIALAEADFEPVYFDISDRLSDFARWRFQRRNLQVEMAKGWEALGARTFDAVVSFDVFEHIKDLPVCLKQLCGHLRPGGLLVFSGAFSGGGAHLVENEPYAVRKNLLKLMDGCGMTYVDQFSQFYFFRKLKQP